jgi:hypothetical protein
MNLEELKKKKTKSLCYLLPLIGTKTDKITEFHNNEVFPRCNFINVYRHCESLPELKEHIFVLYKYDANFIFSMFLDKMKKNSNFHSLIKTDEVSILIVYKVPNHRKYILPLFDNGEFSKFKHEEKQTILNFWNVTVADKFGPVGVLYKQEWKKKKVEELIGMDLPHDAELTSIPNVEEETYYNKYKLINSIQDIEEINN